MHDDSRTLLAIEKHGSIFNLLQAFLDAYEARTDVLSGGDTPNLETIIEMLRSVAGMPAELALIKDELSLVHGLVTSSRVPELLTAVNNLTGKVEELMAKQEERLKAIQAALPAIQDGIDKLQAQVEELKSNNPDLEDELTGIEQTLAAIGEDLNPTTTGGGTTGGTTGGGTEPTGGGETEPGEPPVRDGMV